MALKPGTPVFWHTLYVLQNNKTQIELRLRKPEIKVVFFQSQKEHIEQNHELIEIRAFIVLFSRLYGFLHNALPPT